MLSKIAEATNRDVEWFLNPDLDPDFMDSREDVLR